MELRHSFRSVGAARGTPATLLVWQVHLQRQAAELKEKVELALTEKRPKLERVLGGSHDFMNLLEFGNLNKMHYQVDLSPPARRPTCLTR